MYLSSVLKLVCTLLSVAQFTQNRVAKGYMKMSRDFDLEFKVLGTIWLCFILMILVFMCVCIFLARNNSIEKRRTPTYATTANILKTNKLLLITPLIENSLKMDVEAAMNRPKPYKPSFSWS